MRFTPTKLINLTVFLCLLLISFSCSKDSDILADGNLKDPSDPLGEYDGNEDDIEYVSRTTTFFAVADAYIEGTDGYDLDVVRLQENVRTSYILFDLSPIQGEITAVTLRFTIDRDQGSGNISVFKGQSNNWSEESLAESNAPALAKELGAINKAYAQGATEVVQLSAADFQPEKTTLILTHSAGDDLAIASKENSSQNGPELVVTYNAPANSDEIEQEQPDPEDDPESGFVGESPNFGPLKAFPLAFGAGSQATGGRGFPVVQVTNLNDSGPGSLRDALSAGNRTIVFTVSGIIRLNSPLTVTGDNITIAGQTAPAGGIAITGTSLSNNLRWRGDNAIIRYIRFRPVFEQSNMYDGVDFSGSNKNIIVDHCSFAWGGDEAVSFVGGAASSGADQSDNITFQRNIIYKGWKGTIMGYSNYKQNSGRPNGDFSYNQNLIAHTSHRFPVIVTDERGDVINNVVHNWFERLTIMNAPSDIDLNYQGNYLQNGCNSYDPADSPQIHFNVLDYEPENGIPMIYTDGNYSNQNPSAAQEQLFTYWDDPSSGAVVGDHVSSQLFIGAPFPQLGHSFSVLSAQAAKDDLTSGGAGAVWRLDANGNKVQDRDVLDTAAINDVINNNCVSYTYNDASWQNSAEYNNYRSTITGSPINTHSSNYDTDADGMPDSWERAMYGDLSRTAYGDENGNGYTNLEEYLNLVDF